MQVSSLPFVEIISYIFVNNLKSGDKCYEGELTYRAGPQWIFELDVCIISYRNLE